MATLRTPPPDAITPTTPLTLEIAAELAFPDGSKTGPALRRMVAAGQLGAERIGGRLYTTLADIEQMRGKCRVNLKAPASPSTAEACGSSATEKQTVALDAMNMTAKVLSENLQPTSCRSQSGQDSRYPVARNATYC
jgi:hypothetical protein